jgi:hypothetical protein
MGIKKGIIGKYPQMITSNNIRGHGISKGQASQEFKIFIDKKIVCGVLDDTRSVHDSFFRKMIEEE